MHIFVDVEKGKKQCERYVLEDPTLQKKEQISLEKGPLDVVRTVIDCRYD